MFAARTEHGGRVAMNPIHQSTFPLAFMLSDSFWIWPEQRLCHLPGTPVVQVAFLKMAARPKSLETDFKKHVFICSFIWAAVPDLLNSFLSLRTMVMVYDGLFISRGRHHCQSANRSFWWFASQKQLSKRFFCHMSVLKYLHTLTEGILFFFVNWSEGLKVKNCSRKMF